jgi:hypothetical protein
MKRTWMWVVALAVVATMAATTVKAQGTASASGTPAFPAGGDFQKRDYSGPRLGMLWAVGGPKMRSAFRDHGYGDVISLFGWQFERTIVPVRGGPTLVTEATPMLGGVEYGKILPSITFSAGLRLRNGFEFGMGPSFTPINSHGGATTGLVTAIGKSIDYEGLHLPVNLSFSTNPKGTMVALTLGYAMRRD